MQDWLMDPLERGLFAVISWLATLCWNGDRALLTAAVQIYAWRNALTNPDGLITHLVQNLTRDPTIRGLLGGALELALLLAAILFGLRVLIGRQWDVVDLPRLAAWLLLAGLLLGQGPALVGDLERARAGLSSAAYAVAAAVNGGMNYRNPEMPPGTPGSLGPLTHIFPATTQLGPGELDGIDVSAAYLFASQEDVNGTTNAGDGLPPLVQQQYFTTCAGGTCASPWPDNGMSEQARQQALAHAFAGLVRLFTGAVPVLFALEQSLVYLTLAVSAAILVTALLVTLMFGFFRPTESLPLGVLQSYVRLFVLTYLVTLLLDILMGFLVYWARSDNWVAFLGAGALVVVLTIQPVFMGFGTIRAALSAALGGQNPTPGMGALLAAGGAAVALTRGARPATTPEQAPAGGPEIRDGIGMDNLPIPNGGRQPGDLAATELEPALRPRRAAPDSDPWNGASEDQDAAFSTARPAAIPAVEVIDVDPNRLAMNRYLQARGIPPIRSRPFLTAARPALPAGVAGTSALDSAADELPSPPSPSALPPAGITGDAEPTAEFPAPLPPTEDSRQMDPMGSEAGSLSGTDNTADPEPPPAGPVTPMQHGLGRRAAAAQEFAARGWPVFPLGKRSKIPLKGSGGFTDATTDPAQIAAWWSQGAYNVGIATGAPSGLLVIDVDTHTVDGRPFVADHPELFPPTVTALTPTGGHHLYYRLPPGTTTRSSVGDLAPGVDSRGDGGYIVAPPSSHPGGGVYRWAPGAGPSDRALAEAPAELVAHLQPVSESAVPPPSTAPMTLPVAAGRPAPDVLLDWGLKQAQIGNRDNTGFRLARQLLANGYSGGEGEAIMAQYADRVPQAIDDPYTRADALRNCVSAQHYPILEPWGPPAGAQRTPALHDSALTIVEGGQE